MNYYDSDKIIRETFALYDEQTGNPPLKLSGEIILHLYPKEDTIDADGNLNGFYQIRFFDLVIFSVGKCGKKGRMWRVGKKDAVMFPKSGALENATVFKDGAFCIKINGTYEITYGQDVMFHKVN